MMHISELLYHAKTQLLTPTLSATLLTACQQELEETAQEYIQLDYQQGKHALSKLLTEAQQGALEEAERLFRQCLEHILRFSYPRGLCFCFRQFYGQSPADGSWDAELEQALYDRPHPQDPWVSMEYQSDKQQAEQLLEGLATQVGEEAQAPCGVCHRRLGNLDGAVLLPRLLLWLPERPVLAGTVLPGARSVKDDGTSHSHRIRSGDYPAPSGTGAPPRAPDAPAEGPAPRRIPPARSRQKKSPGRRPGARRMLLHGRHRAGGDGRPLKRKKMKKMDWATWNQPTNSAGSIPLSLQVTEKWTWGSRAFSVRAVWPTVPMTSPQETMSPAATAVSSDRLE